MKKFCVIAAITSLFKLLLLPSYKSTDFEVHRNWLSITYNLPLSKWYQENTSEWTLDYPPFFAYFEFLLSQFAPFFDKNMLKISKKGYSSYETVLFQRLTVILTDFIYYYACYCWYKYLSLNKNLKKKVKDPLYKSSYIFIILSLWLPSLILVDHIHFQYNGFLNGILLLSILKLIQKKVLQSSALFIILLNFKHIYLYVAPVYFVYILRNYCLNLNYYINFKNCTKLASLIFSIFSLSFGLFIYEGQFNNILNRLFPVKRGLTHSYWAPNFWANYNFLDKVLGLYLGNKNNKVSMTGGLVEEFEHDYLPKINILTCTILVLITMMPTLFILWKRSNKKNSELRFIQCLILTTFSSFLFGWHVHEKAIIMILVPMLPLIFYKKEFAKYFFILNTIATFSIFPLLKEPRETPTKILLLILYNCYAYYSINEFHLNSKKPFKVLNSIEMIYILGFFIIQFYTTFTQIIFTNIHNRFPFLYLMITSLYCSLGVIYIWLRFYINLIYEE